MTGALPPAPPSFAALALPLLDDIAGFALSLTRDRSEADDLVQETYLRALRGWHTFDADTDCRPWLFTVCRNAFLRTRERRRVLVESAEEDADGEAAARDHAAAVAEGLGDLFDRIEVRPAIAGAVAALAEPHRSILVLVDVEGMSYEDAGRVLGVPPGTVRSRLFRARRRVQQTLVEHARDMGIGRATPGAPHHSQPLEGS